MIATLTSLREEDRELLQRIEWLKEVADLVDLASVEAVITELEEAYIFLTHHVLPQPGRKKKPSTGPTTR